MRTVAVRAIGLFMAAGLAASVSASQTTGPSSSQSPYLVPVPGGPAVDVVSILTTGDSVNLKPDGITPYRMVGIPDGLGAYDNGDGTMTVLMNHELGTTQGVARAHGGTGAFVSRWVVSNSAGPNFLRVNNGRDLDDSVVTTSAGSGTANSFNRYCSGDLAPRSAYYNAATGNGTQRRIFMSGEESGNSGRVMAHVVDASGANTGVAYQLNAFDGLGAWENELAHPDLGDTTLVMANSDGGTRNGVYAYVGTKRSTGSDIERAGLVGGTTYSMVVNVNGSTVPAEDRTLGFATSGSPVLSGRFGFNPITRDAAGAVTGGNNATTFLRPEDGAWDPSRPNDYYFVTTDRLDQVRDGVGTQAGRSRLWRMRYDNAANPTAGGSIEAVLDGTEGQNMFDNICVVPGVDGVTRLLLCEDTGNAAHNAKVWMYDTSTDSLSLVLQHDPARFGDISVNPTAPYTVDEESSGVIDARDTLGLGWFLIDVQDHHSISGELTEGGQLMAFYLPSAIPEPGALALLGLAAAGAARRRR